MGIIRAIHTRLIMKFLGMSFMVIAGLQLISMGVALYFQESQWMDFLISMGITLGVGLLLFVSNPVRQETSITIRDSFLIVIILWFFVPAAGMLPFYLGTPIDTIQDALFESYAGFTTTGFTNLAKYELLPKSIIFWKSVIQWLGGMGLLIFIIALFPLVKEGEYKIFFSDIQDTSYKPLHYKVSGTARRLWLVYLLMTLMGIGALMLAGQNWFDAFCFSLSTISTGGGVPFNGNITHLSLPVKSVLALLMLIAGANYVFVFQLFRKQKNITNDEFLSYIRLFVFSAIFIICAQVFRHGFHAELVFESIFNTVSFVSTTGFYSNTFFDSKILFVWILLFFLLFIGSSTGSSGGGINIYRLMIMFRTLKNYIKTSIHPNSYYQTTFNKIPVTPLIINRIYAFFVLYVLIFFIGTLILSAMGFSFNNAVGFCAASLSNTGPGVFLLNGNTELSEIHEGAKLVIIFLMVIGRIELFPFLLIFSKSFWRP
jgi:trk system potassium uptake protein